LIGLLVLGATRADAGQFERPTPSPAPFVVELPNLLPFEVPLPAMLLAQLRQIHLSRHNLCSPKGATAAAPPRPFTMEASSDRLYRQGREQIDAGRYDSAVQIFDRLVGQESERADAALYWKAYSLSKLSRRDDALATLADSRSASPRAAG